MELKDIKAIIDLMKKNSITEFELERQDSKIRLKRGMGGGAPVVQEESYPMAPVSMSAGAPPTIAPPPVAAATGEIEIKSPMIGTFYRAPSPEAGAYVEVGTEVNPDTVVCIIEAMKVMNEIKAEVSGSVVEVCAENGKPVQFEQVLFRVK